jgi:hypothetical protein
MDKIAAACEFLRAGANLEFASARRTGAAGVSTMRARTSNLGYATSFIFLGASDAPELRMSFRLELIACTTWRDCKSRSGAAFVDEILTS